MSKCVRQMLAKAPIAGVDTRFQGASKGAGQAHPQALVAGLYPLFPVVEGLILAGADLVEALSFLQQDFYEQGREHFKHEMSSRRVLHHMTLECSKPLSYLGDDGIAVAAPVGR